MATSINDALRSRLAGRFFTARKTKPLWAARVSDAVAARIIGPDRVVQTIEGPVTAKPSDALCKGLAGEFWVQGFDQVEKKYQATGAKVREPAGEGTGPGIEWTEYAPKPDRTVQAAPVEDVEQFQVQSNYGLLTGKKGDYVVFIERHPDDMWIVAKGLFEQTYARC